MKVETANVEAFAARLKEALKARGLDAGRGALQRIANHCGVSHTAVRKWLMGEQMPDAMHQIRLAEYVRINPLWLALGEGRMEMPVISHEEERLIKNYRAADARGKRAVDAIAEVEANYVTP
jgi:transcriptional regulator with XRE-family HTH domain